MKIIYCHGLPGSASEIEGLVPEHAAQPCIIGPQDLAGFDQAAKLAFGGFHIIGFSLGAMTAIQMAAKRPEAVKKMSLIAPAAPLELGDFLPHMAGGPVFKMAMKGDLSFKLFTAMQRLGAGVAPNKIIQTMFDGSPEADMALLSDPGFTSSLNAGLRSSLGPHNGAYRAAVRAYVQPWSHLLDHVKCPVNIYHGTEDNWAPIEMSYAIEKKISPPAQVVRYDHLGHYSALHRAFPIIFSSG